MSAGRARAVEAALFALTVAATLTAREPADGAAHRWLFAAACLVAAGLVWRYSRGARPSARRVVIGAVLLRAVAFPLPPSLSDDAYRYVWDGMLQADGINPYLHRPADDALALRHGEPVFERLNSEGYYSVYPPASQLAFRAGGAVYDFGWQPAYYAIKAVITVVELGGVVLLLRIAPAAAVVLYAWHPLPVLEVAGQGHTEGLAVLGLALAAWGVARRRGWWSGAGLAIAGGAKLLPLVLVPFAARRAGPAVIASVVLVCAALAAPFVAPGAAAHVAESLSLYVRSFEFAAGPYLALKAAAAWAGFGDVSKTLGPLLGIVFAVGFAAILVRDRPRDRGFAAGASAVYGLFLATATTVYPWYLVAPLALAPLLRRPAAWAWAATVAPATYLFYTGPWGAYAAAVAIGWLGAVTLAFAEPAVDGVLRRRGQRKWDWIVEAVGPIRAGARVLDLGAGEGYVGAAAARAGAVVTLADIVDSNRTTLPHLVTDGDTTQVGDGAMDLVLLVFVLHHARDPASLLAEARRVTRGRVVVVETVPERAARRRTETLDRLVNRLRPRSLRDQERHLHMRPAAEWRRVLHEAGLEIVDERRRGGAVHPQVLFVTRPVEASSTRTPDASGAT